MHFDIWLDERIKELKNYANEERDAPYYSDVLFAIQYLEKVSKGITDAWSGTK